MPRHFLTGEELTHSELRELLERATELKAAPLSSDALHRKTVALFFEQPSTRTRTSFEAGIVEMGGHPMILRSSELQLSRGESVRDTAYVLSRQAAVIGMRASEEAVLHELARHATVPVVNLLSPDHHPCQVLADLLTLREALGGLDGLRLAYVGDGNNVARSLGVIACAAGVSVTVSSPAGYTLEDLPGVRVLEDPREAVRMADAVYTDVWVSMSDDDRTATARREALGPYRVDDELLSHAAEHAIVLHCLPAHPGEEITESVLYGERQRIWDQAENRRHAQKALLEFLVS